MDLPKIRNATLDDVPALVPLLNDLGYPTTESALKKHFTHFISQHGYGIAVAVLKGNVVGFVAWSLSFFFVSNTTRFRIEGLLVDDRYRGLGVGKKLMQHVEDIAQSKSPAVVELTSGKRRAIDGAHTFYKNLGYKNEGLTEKVYLRKTF